MKNKAYVVFAVLISCLSLGLVGCSGNILEDHAKLDGEYSALGITMHVPYSWEIEIASSPDMVEEPYKSLEQHASAYIYSPDGIIIGVESEQDRFLARKDASEFFEIFYRDNPQYRFPGGHLAETRDSAEMKISFCHVNIDGGSYVGNRAGIDGGSYTGYLVLSKIADTFHKILILAPSEDFETERLLIEAIVAGIEYNEQAALAPRDTFHLRMGDTYESDDGLYVSVLSVAGAQFELTIENPTSDDYSLTISRFFAYYVDMPYQALRIDQEKNAELDSSLRAEIVIPAGASKQLTMYASSDRALAAVGYIYSNEDNNDKARWLVGN